MKYILKDFYDLDKIFSTEDISQTIWQINNIAFSFVYKDELTLFIQNNQKALVNFKTEGKHPQAADEILYFIETNFYDHLTTSLPISELTKKDLIRSFGGNSELLQTVVKNLPVSVLEFSYPLFSLNSASVVTVQQNQYYRSFYPFLVKHILKVETITTEDKWCAFLIKANFNHLKFTNYLINCIVKETSLEDYTDSHLEILSEQLKTTASQIPKF